MRKIWKLYIIFVLFFVFGDLLSTFAILEVREQVRSGEKVAARPPECIVKLPQHCDTNIIGEVIKDNFKIKVTLLKIALAALVLIMVFMDLRIMLLGLTVVMVLVTGNNLAILLYDVRSIFLYLETIAVYYLVSYFTKWDEED